MRPTNHYTRAWPHPRQRRSDPVDPRLVRVVRRALRDPVNPGLRAAHISAKVWDWLAEGDGSSPTSTTTVDDETPDVDQEMALIQSLVLSYGALVLSASPLESEGERATAGELRAHVLAEIIVVSGRVRDLRLRHLGLDGKGSPPTDAARER